MTKPRFINSIRSDLSDWLIHCTQSTDNLLAFEVLQQILQNKILKGNSKFIKGPYNCVCFSESPLTKIKSLITYCDEYKWELISLDQIT